MLRSLYLSLRALAKKICAELSLQRLSSRRLPAFAPQIAEKGGLLGAFYRVRRYGGGRGIRTPGTVSRTAVFKTACFNRSHIPPLGGNRELS